MRALRPAGDVARLPTVTFGSRSLMWWGTVGFMVIEGFTLTLLLAGYLYLRQNVESWPPLRTPNPGLLIPTINMALMLVSCAPAYLADRAAKRLEKDGVRLWLTVGGALGIVLLV